MIPEKRPLKVLFVSSEVTPFAKTGGLGDVVGSLPKVLHRRGIDVRVVMPLYAGIDWNALEKLEGSLHVPMWWGTARSAVRLGRLPGSDVPVYFLEYHRYFDRPYLYGPPGHGYDDNLERFVFLSRGALELAKAINYLPDIIHANDWQTALVPVYVNTVEWAQPLHGAATVYTIHNLAYQGVTEEGSMFITGLGREHYHSGEFEHFGALNLAKAAVRHSNMLSTVSPTYAREIQTSEHGCGLDGELSARRSDLVGILNGIDTEAWDPTTDPHIAAHFSADHLEGKELCKAALQAEAGLPTRNVPLFGVVGRLTIQKGFDVLAHCMDRLLSWDLQIVLLGSGDREAEHYFGSLSSYRPDKFRAWIGFDNGLAHRIEAGADFFLMPSRFEPCGLNQMYSQRYGTLPIVRGTGGLIDTVENYVEATGGGTGFIFFDLTPNALANTIGWALSTYFDRPGHVAAMRKHAMERDFSWEGAAKAYQELYLAAYQRRRGHHFEGFVLGDGQGNGSRVFRAA
ncbi:MAG TPA: glycogen synthase GlgA [Anaeromyxobacteraceae bacterium]|nr:glycogen synthase GlgA [Anaeromyxobacteraceae bacterium]